MTLVVTFGDRNVIVAAADSVVTQMYQGAVGSQVRLLTGVQKLFACESARCIVSSWGDARLLRKPVTTTEVDLEINSGDVPVQLWLQDLLAQTDVTKPADLAHRLLSTLTSDYLPVRSWAGLDLAYFDEDGEPTVLRVSNGDGPKQLYGTFEMRKAVRLSYGEGLDDLRAYSAGESNARRLADEFRNALNNGLVRMDQAAAFESYRLARYAGVIVRSVADALNTLELGKSVGGPVCTAELRRGEMPVIRFG